MNKPALSWWSKDTVAVVTGANRGVGLAIVRQLAEQGLTVVLTSRDSTKGQAAVDDLVVKGVDLVVFHQLDTSDSKETKQYRTDSESAKYVLDINYYGVKKVTTTLLPLLRPSNEGALMINVSSRNGLYKVSEVLIP